MPFDASPPASPLILHVVGSLQGGGAERCVRELIPRLRSRGANAEIATVYMPNLAPRELRELGCEVHFRPKRAGFDPVHCWWLSRVIARRRPAIVHTHQWAGKYVGRVAAILAGVPIIVHTEHSPNPVVGAERVMTQLLWRRTAAVITFGQENAVIVRRREPVGRFELIRNGLQIPPMPTPSVRSEARKALKIEPDVVVFAIVASLQERKNHRLAFAALALLKNDPGPKVRLTLFGDGTLRRQLADLAAELGITEMVTFEGFRSDVRALLPAVDVFMSVSLLEMAPISILEAMATCIPVLATRHAGTHDMVEDDVTGAIMGWDAAEVAAAMRRARDDVDWRVSRGLAGRARVERNHDLESIADQHLAFYDRILSSA